MANNPQSSVDIFDKFVLSQAAQVDVSYQQMQEMDDLLEHLHNSASIDVYKHNETLEALLSDIKNVGESVSKLLIDGAEMSVLAGIEASMSLAVGIVGLSAGPIVYAFGTKQDRGRFREALGIAASPSTLLGSIVFSAQRNANSGDTLHQGAKYGVGVDAIRAVAEAISTSPTTTTDRPGSVARANLIRFEGAQAASELESDPFYRLSISGPDTNGTTSHILTVSVDSPIQSQDTMLDFASHLNDARNNLKAVQLEQFGTPQHSLWGDPHASQLRLSNGQRSRGPNLFGPLLPMSLGGTAQGEEDQQETNELNQEQIDDETELIFNPPS